MTHCAGNTIFSRCLYSGAENGDSYGNVCWHVSRDTFKMNPWNIKDKEAIHRKDVIRYSYAHYMGLKIREREGWLVWADSSWGMRSQHKNGSA